MGFRNSMVNHLRNAGTVSASENRSHFEPGRCPAFQAMPPTAVHLAGFAPATRRRME